jgi:hypothetical protein
MKTKIRIIALSIINIGILFSFFMCEDVFEEDISSENIYLIAPSDGVSTEIVSQIFWWDGVKGAIDYNILIVTPSFESIEGVILDSLTVDTRFEYTFSPGNYEWKVIAANSSSQTVSVISSFEIIEDDISSIQFSLLSPPNNSTSKQLGQTFWWEKVQGAEEYNIQIVSPSFNDIEELVIDSIITNNKLNYTLQEKDYQWRVFATNSTSQSESEIFTFNVDTSTNPKQEIFYIGNDNFNKDLNFEIIDLLKLR